MPPKDRTAETPRDIPNPNDTPAEVPVDDTHKILVRANVHIFDLAALEEGYLNEGPEVDACIARGLLTPV